MGQNTFTRITMFTYYNNRCKFIYVPKLQIIQDVFVYYLIIQKAVKYSNVNLHWFAVWF